MYACAASKSQVASHGFTAFRLGRDACEAETEPKVCRRQGQTTFHLELPERNRFGPCIIRCNTILHCSGVLECVNKNGYSDPNLAYLVSVPRLLSNSADSSRGDNAARGALEAAICCALANLMPIACFCIKRGLSALRERADRTDTAPLPCTHDSFAGRRAGSVCWD